MAGGQQPRRRLQVSVAAAWAARAAARAAADFSAVRSYRLCPADEPLTEACFKKNHLEFVAAEQSIVFPNGSLFNIADKAVFVTEGTTPAGSMWSMIPLPTDALGPRCIPGPNGTCESLLL